MRDEQKGFSVLPDEARKGSPETLQDRPVLRASSWDSTGRKLLEPWGSLGRPLSVSMHHSVNVELQPLKKGRVIGDQDGSGRNVGVIAPRQEPGPAGVRLGRAARPAGEDTAVCRESILSLMTILGFFHITGWPAWIMNQSPAPPPARHWPSLNAAVGTSSHELSDSRIRKRLEITHSAGDSLRSERGSLATKPPRAALLPGISLSLALCLHIDLWAAWNVLENSFSMILSQTSFCVGLWKLPLHRRKDGPGRIHVSILADVSRALESRPSVQLVALIHQQ